MNRIRCAVKKTQVLFREISDLPISAEASGCGSET